LTQPHVFLRLLIRLLLAKVAITVEMQCSASGCSFPGEGQTGRSAVEVAVTTTIGCLIVLLIVGLVVHCYWRSRVLQVFGCPPFSSCFFF
jgi:hypothetical protein